MATRVVVVCPQCNCQFPIERRKKQRLYEPTLMERRQIAEVMSAKGKRGVSTTAVAEATGWYWRKAHEILEWTAREGWTIAKKQGGNGGRPGMVYQWILSEPKKITLGD